TTSSGLRTAAPTRGWRWTPPATCTAQPLPTANTSWARFSSSRPRMEFGRTPHCTTSPAAATANFPTAAWSLTPPVTFTARRRRAAIAATESSTRSRRKTVVSHQLPGISASTSKGAGPMLQKASKSTFHATLCAVNAALVFVFALMLVASPAHAQKYKVLHNFTNGGDGGDPYAGLTIDRAGNFYGTAAVGGSAGWGTVYKMSHQGSGWVVIPLYGFKAGNDGANPLSPVTIGPDGSLYGQTIGEYDG